MVLRAVNVRQHVHLVLATLLAQPVPQDILYLMMSVKEHALLVSLLVSLVMVHKLIVLLVLLDTPRQTGKVKTIST